MGEYVVKMQEQWDRRTTALELHMSGVTYAEIARRFGVSTTTAANLCHRAQRDRDANRARPVCVLLDRQKAKAICERERVVAGVRQVELKIPRRFKQVAKELVGVFAKLKKFDEESRDDIIEVTLSRRQFESVTGSRDGQLVANLSGIIVRSRK